MPTIEEKLKVAEEKLRQLKERKAKIDSLHRAKQQKTARTMRERKKYLIGECLLQEMERNPEPSDIQTWMNKRLERFLTKEADRALFALPPKQTQAPQPVQQPVQKTETA